MKKIVIIVIVAVVLAGIVFVSIKGLPSLSLGFLDGERGEAVQGDLVIPVTATGKIQSAEKTQIKSKASGEVQAIHVVEGQLVKAGTILVELDPVDEKRNVETRQAAVDRAKSALEKAKIVLAKQKVDLPLQTITAKARLQDARARFGDADFRYKRLKNMPGGVTSDQEMVSAQAARDSAEAAKKISEADLTRATNDEQVLLDSAMQDVLQAQAAHQETLKGLDEANLRLDDTTVRAPSDGMIYNILTKRGEMIQSGTVSLTGGTVLLVLADVRSMFVMAQVDEADIGAIRDIAPEYARPGMTKKLPEDEYKRLGRAVLDAAEKRKAEGSNATESESGASESDAVVPESVSDLVGRPVDVTVEAYRSQTYQGVIERILPEPIQSGGAVSFNVRIRLYGEDLQKLMGLQADLDFETKTQKGVVLVPNEALVSEGRKCYVWVPFRESPRDRWDKKKVPVEIGDTDGTNTVIFSGLEAGDEVWIKPPRFTEREKRERDEA